MLVIIAIALVIGGWMMVQRERTPAWYRPPETDDPVVNARAEDIELAALEILHRVREPDASWGMRMTESQMNTWLATRLREWIRNRGSTEWPETLRMVQIDVEANHATLAIELGDEDDTDVYSMTLTPTVRDEALYVSLTAASIGRLRLRGRPLETLLQRADAPQFGGRLDNVLPYVRGERALDIEFELSDRRRVRVHDITCNAGEHDFIDFTCTTSPRQRSSESTNEAPTE